MKQYLHLSTHILSVLMLLLVPVILQAQHLTAHRKTVQQSYNFWFYEPAPQSEDELFPDKFPQPAPLSAATIYQLGFPLGPIDPILTPAGNVFPSSPDNEAADAALSQGCNTAQKPLVIFLHGASLCGTNLERVRRYGTLDALSRGLQLNAYVLAPQNPGGAWSPAKVDRLVDWSLQNYPIDSTRIYVLGMSLGGYGTIDYAAASSHRVAAAMALCGGATSRRLAGLCQVPLAIIHGTGDRAVSWKASQSVVDAMVAAGDTSRLIYRLLPRQNHGILAQYFYVPEVYDWLFRHTLDDRDRPVCRDYDLSLRIIDRAIRHGHQPNVFQVHEAPIVSPPASR